MMVHLSKRNKTITAAIMTALFCVSAPTLADVVIYAKSVDRSGAVSEAGKPYFSEAGISGEVPNVIHGAGDNMSLELAMKLIAPKEWKYNISGKNAKRVPVTWEGGTSFAHVLRNLGENNKIFVNMDWVSKIVSVNVPSDHKVEQFREKQMGSSKLASNESNNSYAKMYAEQRVARDDGRAFTDSKNKQVELVINNQRKSQTSHSQLVAALHDKNQFEIREKEDLQREVGRLRSELIDAKESVTVVYNSKETETLSALELSGEFSSRTVLPADPSFDYFIRGGHQDKFEERTTATFIANPGTVREIITAWASNIGGGYELDYRPNVDHHVKHKRVFTGDFISVSTDLILKFENSKRPLNISFHPNLGEHGVVVVEDLNYSKAQSNLTKLLNTKIKD
jgi:hypothetical protein